MANRKLCALFFVILSFPDVFGKNPYFEHYFNKYHNHKSSSTTPGVLSTSEISTSEAKIPVSEDDVTSKENSSVEDDNEDSFTVNTTVLHGGGSSDDPVKYDAGFVSRVATIVGSVIFAILVLGCIISCCPGCCRGTERRGFILGNRQTEVLPTPVIIAQPPQPPAAVQHVPPEYTQDPVHHFPPQYQQPVVPPNQYGPMQQQGYQYSPMHPQPPYAPVQVQTHYSPIHEGYQNPTLQFYNPPEAPPPYEPMDAKH